MLNLLKHTLRIAGLMSIAGALALAQGRTAQPGTVNHVEGQVSLNGHAITRSQIGSAAVGAGQTLETGNGKAEMLLTPGVFVRIGDHSQVKMISPTLLNTRFQLVAGQAMVEAAWLEKENHLAVTMDDTNTALMRHGLYEFSANPAWIRTLDGKAEVERDGRSTRLYKGDEVALNSANPKLKSHGFNVKATEASDNLYAWSKVRADYMAQANMSAAETYYAGGPGWYGTGWYWDPYFDQYAWLLADGFMWDPFGFGYFSPAYWGYYGPYLGYGYGFGHGFGRYGYGRGFAGRPGGAITRGSARGAVIGGGAGGFGGARGSFGGVGAVRGGFGAVRGGFGGMHGGFGGGIHGGFGGGRR